jgi:hypothetical protein
VFSIFPIEPFHGFFQVVKEQLLVGSGGHDFQGLAPYVMKHPSVDSVIEDKSVPLTDEFRQMCVAFHGSHI